MENFDDLSNDQLRLKMFEYGIPMPINATIRKIVIKEMKNVTENPNTTLTETKNDGFEVENFDKLSDEQLRQKMLEHGLSNVSITPTTRKLVIDALRNFIENVSKLKTSTNQELLSKIYEMEIFDNLSDHQLRVKMFEYGMPILVTSATRKFVLKELKNFSKKSNEKHTVTVNANTPMTSTNETNTETVNDNTSITSTNEENTEAVNDNTPIIPINEKNTEAVNANTPMTSTNKKQTKTVNAKTPITSTNKKNTKTVNANTPTTSTIEKNTEAVNDNTPITPMNEKNTEAVNANTPMTSTNKKQTKTVNAKTPITPMNEKNTEAVNANTPMTSTNSEVENVDNFSDDQLRQKMLEYGLSDVPITSTTRNLVIQIVKNAIRKSNGKRARTPATKKPPKRSRKSDSSCTVVPYSDLATLSQNPVP